VVGVVLIVIVLVLAVPVGVMVAGIIWSALLGTSLVDDAETRADGAPN
jgi:hypothetical protein